MSRYQFGGQLSHYGINLVDGVDGENDILQAQGGDQVRAYNQETGGTEYTDLSEDSGGASPITTLLTSTGGDGRATGQIPPFYGPDSVRQMWVSIAGGPRGLIVASNIDELGDDVVLTGRLRAADGIGAFGVTPPTSRPIINGARNAAGFVTELIDILTGAGLAWDMSSPVPNQLTNGDFSADLDNWNGDNATIAMTTTEVNGPESASLTAISAADMAIRNGAVSGVAAGNSFTFSYWVLTTVTRTCRIQIDWHQAGFAGYISTSMVGDVSCPAGVRTKVTATVTAPALAGQAVVAPRILSAGLGEVAYVADVQAYEL